MPWLRRRLAAEVDQGELFHGTSIRCAVKEAFQVLPAWPFLPVCADEAGRTLMPDEPVAPAYPAELQRQLQAALVAKGADYRPRTIHLLSDGTPRYTNRLILEDSPYLQQHAHNPVDWFPWGREAFERAKRECKPVFLSIGYSTCHWCHVMEEESFDNPDIARLLNRYFVAVKVDRESHPDVDRTYMMAIMLLNGAGGWPMSSFLTPDGKSFFGGTYFPRPKFAGLLKQIHAVWEQRRDEVQAEADRVATAVSRITAASGRARELGDGVIRKAVAAIVNNHDKVRGGFGPAPKFPHEPALFLLLKAAERQGDRAALATAENSLMAMARGGIYDQVGGGFHRYSMDDVWLVPHFEKMLYNQAHLARVYLLAWRLTGNPLYERVVRETLDYVLREMTSPEGGFYSATDADSEGEEGRFFLWTPEQIRQALPPEDAELALELYGVTQKGNFEGRSILHLPVALDVRASRKKMSLETLLERVDRIRERLRGTREVRIQPLRDEKILTAWNGAMISTLAMAGDLLQEARYLMAAKRAAELLWTKNRPAPGELWRVHLEGRSSVAAAQEDYAYYAEGLLQLYDASGDDLWLARAREIADAMLVRFWDEQGGGFFMSEGDALSPMGRPKDSSDDAMPSGNSVALRVLAMLMKRSGTLEYSVRANAALMGFSTAIERQPDAFAYMLAGADDLLRGETAPLQYAARGAVRAKAHVTLDQQRRRLLRVEVDVAPGWHINAHRPLQNNLVPTVLELGKGAAGWELGEPEYPSPEIRRLGFQQEALALHEGRVRLQAELRPVGDTGSPMGAMLPVRLNLQACDDNACLPPERLELGVPQINLFPPPCRKL